MSNIILSRIIWVILNESFQIGRMQLYNELSAIANRLMNLIVLTSNKNGKEAEFHFDENPGVVPVDFQRELTRLATPRIYWPF